MGTRTWFEKAGTRVRHLHFDPLKFCEAPPAWYLKQQLFQRPVPCSLSSHDTSPLRSPAFRFSLPELLLSHQSELSCV